MAFEKITIFSNIDADKKADDVERNQKNIQKFLDMDEEQYGNPDRLPLEKLKNMRHLDPDTVPNGPWPLGKDFPAEEEFAKAGLLNKDEEIGDLTNILNAPADKIIPFNLGRIKNSSENNETGAVMEKTLAELSEKYRQYLSLPFNKEKGFAFLKIQQEKELIKKIFGAKDVIFGLDGDIFKVDALGRQEKIYDNTGLPVENANVESATNKTSVLSDEELKEKEPAILPAGEKSFFLEDFNINEPFTNVEAARFLAKQDGYLNLNQVPSFSPEVLSALQERNGITGLVGLQAENVDEAAAAILKKFKSTTHFNDRVFEKMEKITSVPA
jgi:hypothetical protein